MPADICVDGGQDQAGAEWMSSGDIEFGMQPGEHPDDQQL